MLSLVPRPQTDIFNLMNVRHNRQGFWGIASRSKLYSKFWYRHNYLPKIVTSGFGATLIRLTEIKKFKVWKLPRLISNNFNVSSKYPSFLSLTKDLTSNRWNFLRSVTVVSNFWSFYLKSFIADSPYYVTWIQLPEYFAVFHFQGNQCARIVQTERWIHKAEVVLL